MNILFVGNSYSYRGNSGSRELSPYGMFEDMAAAGGHSITLDNSWIGGSALETHWQDTTGDQARQLLATGDFDLVVLQGTVTDIPDSNTGHSAENFDLYADLFADLAADNGTESLFMPSWTPDYLTSISGGDLFVDDTHTSNEAAALRNDGYYAPVSLAFEAAHMQLTTRYGGGDDGQAILVCRQLFSQTRQCLAQIDEGGFFRVFAPKNAGKCHSLMGACFYRKIGQQGLVFNRAEVCQRVAFPHCLKGSEKRKL